jgi:hypothetical protein
MIPAWRAHLAAIQDHGAAAFVVAAAAVGRGRTSARTAGERGSEEEVWRALRGLVGPASRPPPPGIDALALANLARLARVGVLAAGRHPALARPLGGTLAAAERHAALLALVTEQLGATLGPLATATCLLKGSAAIALAYGHPAERERRDLDLLVDAAAFVPLRAALWNAGWRDDPNRDAPGPPFSGRTLAMRRRFGAVTVSLDLHRDLVDRDWCGLHGEAFRRSFLSQAEANRAALPVSSATHTFLHTVAHLVAGGFPATLAPWVDLSRLLPLCGPDDLAKAAAAHRLRAATWLGLTTLSRWFDLDTGHHRAALRLPRTRERLLGLVYGGHRGTPATAATSEPRAVHAARALLRD